MEFAFVQTRARKLGFSPREGNNVATVVAERARLGIRGEDRLCNDPFAERAGACPLQ